MSQPISREDLAEMRRVVDAQMMEWIGSDDATLRALSLVHGERDKQKSEWGKDHDLQHLPGDWSRFLIRHIGRAEQAIEDDDPKAWRKQMIRVAALAVAAIEAHDRAAALDDQRASVEGGTP